MMFPRVLALAILAVVGLAGARPTVRNIMVGNPSRRLPPDQRRSFARCALLFIAAVNLSICPAHTAPCVSCQNNAEFTKIIKHHKEKTGLPVIVDYYSDGCGPCRQIAPLCVSSLSPLMCHGAQWTRSLTTLTRSQV